MVLLRKALVRLRAEYAKDSKKLFIVLAAAVALTGIITVLVDTFLPFSGVSNILRSLLLVPTSVAIFSLGYSVSLFFHYKQNKENLSWAPYRTRFSPMWRKRIAIIIGAVLLVIAQGTNRDVGYTLVSSVLGAIVIAVIAFIRSSKEEASREELGIPDSRDVIYDSRKRKVEREQALKRAAKDKKRSRLANRGRKKTSTPRD